MLQIEPGRVANWNLFDIYRRLHTSYIIPEADARGLERFFFSTKTGVLWASPVWWSLALMGIVDTGYKCGLKYP